MSRVNKNISTLTDHIGYWLRMISNSVSHEFAKKIQKNGVTVAEWVVLRNMYSNENRISPSSISNMTGLTRGAVSKLVDRLFQKGLVTRTESSNDRRFQELELTSSAILLLPKLASIADKNDNEFFSGLSDSEKKILKEILIKIAKTHQLSKAPIE